MCFRTSHDTVWVTFVDRNTKKKKQQQQLFHQINDVLIRYRRGICSIFSFNNIFFNVLMKRLSGKIVIQKKKISDFYDVRFTHDDCTYNDDLKFQCRKSNNILVQTYFDNYYTFT